MDEGRQPGSTSCNHDPSEDISHILSPLRKRMVAPFGDQVKSPDPLLWSFAATSFRRSVPSLLTLKMSLSGVL
jgi:hypothetical protein